LWLKYETNRQILAFESLLCIDRKFILWVFEPGIPIIDIEQSDFNIGTVIAPTITDENTEIKVNS
jgi:hypothetical protein